ncbi:unnamed protein product, partial [Musa acuminata subsp. malaccensis]
WSCKNCCFFCLECWICLFCVKFARSHRLTSLWLNKPSDRSK